MLFNQPSIFLPLVQTKTQVSFYAEEHTLTGLYCGRQFPRAELTRDHVLPTSRGGRDRWENVVAACRRCNWQKDNRTPEEAEMPLLAVPFRPNVYEWHFLARERVLADQMDYLSRQFRAERDWAN